jgi:hypothetical protein
VLPLRLWLLLCDLAAGALLRPWLLLCDLAAGALLRPWLLRPWLLLCDLAAGALLRPWLLLWVLAAGALLRPWLLLWVLAAGALLRPWLLLCVLAAGALLRPWLLLWVLCSVGAVRRVAAWSEVAAGVVLLPVVAGALFTVPVVDLRVSLPWLTAGRESLLLWTEVVDLRLSPFCAAAGLPAVLRPSPF